MNSFWLCRLTSRNSLARHQPSCPSYWIWTFSQWTIPAARRKARHIFQLDPPQARSVADDDRRDGGSDIGGEIGRGIVDRRNHRLGMLVEAPAKARRRRNSCEAESRLEKLIIPLVLDRIEIALASAEQSDVAFDAIGMGNAVPKRDRRQVFRKAGVPDCTPDQRQSRVRGQRISSRSHDLEAPHRPSPAEWAALAPQIAGSRLLFIALGDLHPHGLTETGSSVAIVLQVPVSAEPDNMVVEH